MSRKILDLARDQQEEIARELGEEEWEDEEEQQAEPWVLSFRSDPAAAGPHYGR
jgi:hypothetical protein